MSLGCPKNRVDTERLLGRLGNVRPVAHIGKSRLVFINTCGFIESAVSESIRAILDAAKKAGDIRQRPLLAVAGCMVSRYGAEELARELPEVDIWLPFDKIDEWADMIRASLGQCFGESGSRVISTPKSYAWLKIAEGCRHRCAFCAIPQIRGSLRSVPSDSLVREASEIAAKGVREICLVAQDCADYGHDLGKGENLPALLEKLCRIEGFAWIRLLYLYPRGITHELLEAMRAMRPHVLPYLDIPLQHSHPEILACMGRPFAGEASGIIEMARETLPGCALRTSLIVGYPGETEEHFEHLCRFVEKARFTHLGIFAYSAEEGTKAAKLPGQVPENVKEDRKNRLATIQAGISRENLAAYLYTRQTVLVDSQNPEWPGLYNGRLWFQAPEADGITYVSAAGAQAGDMLECTIEDSYDYDLSALAE